jgi:hypothetical protein
MSAAALLCGEGESRGSKGVNGVSRCLRVASGKELDSPTQQQTDQVFSGVRASRQPEHIKQPQAVLSEYYQTNVLLLPPVLSKSPV